MTEEQKIEALQRILQGANVAQVNLGNGYQTFNIGKDGNWQQEPTADAQVVDAEVVEYADAQEGLYPEVADEAKSFFEKTYMSEETDKNGKRIKKNFPVEDVLHSIYNETKEWDPSDKKSTRKWKVLYELLRRKKFFKYEERHRYSHYVKGIVRYCFPDAKDSYGNNISKCDLDDSIEEWHKEDKELYFFLKDRMPK